MVEKPSYYAILPANVRYSKAVCDGAKLLYGEITCLCNKEGYCWASNAYFSELYSKSSDTISRWISELARAGFIFPIVDNSAGNSRKIWLKEVVPIGKNADTLSAKMPTPYRQKSVEGIGKNAEHNNKENNKKEEGGVTPKKTPSLPKDFDEMLQRVNAEVSTIEAKKEKNTPVPAAPSFCDEMRKELDILEREFKAPTHVVTAVDGQALPGALVTTVEGLNLEQTTRESVIALQSRLKISPKAENAMEAQKIIVEWCAGNKEQVDWSYESARRKCTAEDVVERIIDFCGHFSTTAEVGKQLLFFSDPARMFQNGLTKWLQRQNQFDREQAAKTPTIKRSGAPNSFGGDQSKFKEVQKF